MIILDFTLNGTSSETLYENNWELVYGRVYSNCVTISCRLKLLWSQKYHKYITRVW